MLNRLMHHITITLLQADVNLGGIYSYHWDLKGFHIYIKKAYRKYRYRSITFGYFFPFFYGGGGGGGSNGKISYINLSTGVEAF